MVASASSVSARPGICTRIWSLPCSCTVASEAPSAFTRLSMMARDFSMSSGVTGAPSVDFAVSTTDRPPWMSRPWLIFSCGGVNMKTDPSTSRVVMMSSQTLRRSIDRPGRFCFLAFCAFAMRRSPRSTFELRGHANPTARTITDSLCHKTAAWDTGGLIISAKAGTDAVHAPPGWRLGGRC